MWAYSMKHCKLALCRMFKKNVWNSLYIYIWKTSDFLRIAFTAPRQHWGECWGQCHCDFSDEFYWEVWEKCLLSSAPNIEFSSHPPSLTFYLAGFVMVQTQRPSYHSYPQPSKDYLRTLRQQWSCKISLVLQSNEFWPILHHNIETEMPECATVVPLVDAR